MTVQTEATFKRYQPGSAEAAEALTGIVFFDPADIVVLRIASDGSETTLTRDVHYTMGGNGATGQGTITAIGDYGSDTFHVERRTPAQQDVRLEAFVDLPLAEIERQLDDHTLVDQELRRDLVRTVQVPRGESGVTITIGDPGDVLLVNANGDIETQPLEETETYAATLAQASDFADRAEQAESGAVAAKQSSDANLATMISINTGAGALDKAEFPNVDAVLQDISINVNVPGRIWSTPYYSFLEVDDAEPDYDRASLGGRRLRVLPVNGDEFHDAAFGCSHTSTGVFNSVAMMAAQAALTRNGGGKFVWVGRGERRYAVTGNSVMRPSHKSCVNLTANQACYVNRGPKVMLDDDQLVDGAPVLMFSGSARLTGQSWRREKGIFSGNKNNQPRWTLGYGQGDAAGCIMHYTYTGVEGFGDDFTIFDSGDEGYWGDTYSSPWRIYVSGAPTPTKALYVNGMKMQNCGELCEAVGFAKIAPKRHSYLQTENFEQAGDGCEYIRSYLVIGSDFELIYEQGSGNGVALEITVNGDSQIDNVHIKGANQAIGHQTLNGSDTGMDLYGEFRGNNYLVEETTGSQCVLIGNGNPGAVTLTKQTFRKCKGSLIQINDPAQIDVRGTLIAAGPVTVEGVATECGVILLTDGREIVLYNFVHRNVKSSVGNVDFAFRCIADGVFKTFNVNVSGLDARNSLGVTFTLSNGAPGMAVVGNFRDVKVDGFADWPAVNKLVNLTQLDTTGCIPDTVRTSSLNINTAFARHIIYTGAGTWLEFRNPPLPGSIVRLTNDKDNLQPLPVNHNAGDAGISIFNKSGANDTIPYGDFRDYEFRLVNGADPQGWYEL